MSHPDAFTRGHTAGLIAGREQGREACDTEHAEMAAYAQETGYLLATQDAQADIQAAERRGRIWGAAVVGVLVGVAVWLGRWRKS